MPNESIYWWFELDPLSNNMLNKSPEWSHAQENKEFALEISRHHWLLLFSSNIFFWLFGGLFFSKLIFNRFCIVADYGWFTTNQRIKFRENMQPVCYVFRVRCFAFEQCEIEGEIQVHRNHGKSSCLLMFWPLFSATNVHSPWNCVTFGSNSDWSHQVLEPFWTVTILPNPPLTITPNHTTPVQPNRDIETRIKVCIILQLQCVHRYFTTPLLTEVTIEFALSLSLSLYFGLINPNDFGCIDSSNIHIKCGKSLVIWHFSRLGQFIDTLGSANCKQKCAKRVVINANSAPEKNNQSSICIKWL